MNLFIKGVKFIQASIVQIKIHLSASSKSLLMLYTDPDWVMKISLKSWLFSVLCLMIYAVISLYLQHICICLHVEIGMNVMRH